MPRDVATESLVGRAPQLERLDRWVRDVVDGRGRAILIEGEAGIGKSSLVRSLTTSAEAAACQIFWGACEELSRAFPLLPVLEALRDRAGDADDRRNAADTDVRRAAILETLRATGAPGVSIDRVAAAVEQLVALFDEVCRSAPVVLVVDDLQWADDATVMTWARLARTAAQRRLLLVGTARPVPQRDDLGALRRLVARESLLQLHGLDPARCDPPGRDAGAWPGRTPPADAGRGRHRQPALPDRAGGRARPAVAACSTTAAWSKRPTGRRRVH